MPPLPLSLLSTSLTTCCHIKEHGYLRGKRKLPPGVANVEGGKAPAALSKSEDAEDRATSRRSMMDLIIETVNRCSEEFDEGVQVQVIKALLVAVTSSHCEVHEASLLLAVRACFHIHLISKNQVNKTTAKAALTQMLSVVNQRMESFDARAKAETEAALSEIEAVGTCAEDDHGSSDATRHTDATHDAPVVSTAAAANDSGGGALEDHRPETDVGGCVATARDKDSMGLGMAFPSILHKDAFLIFRALCKLSMKGLHESDDTGAPTDPIALQNK